ncbi:MAG: RNA polymerase sigma factor [Pseudomonadota bacterium]
MDWSSADDRALVRGWQSGDSAALEALFRRHEDRLFRLALSWLGTQQGAEDAVQDVFERSLKGFVRFRFGAAPFTWLYATLRNVCREHRRQPAGLPLDVEPVSDAPGAAHAYANEATARAVRMAVSMLPDRQREVVMLRVFEDMSVAETAVAMDCRQGTVKALLSKAKANLKLNITVEETR